MQSQLLDILILGLFVVLFGSIYRQRGSARLRFWVGAWLLVVLHFALQMAHPASPFWQDVCLSLSLDGLLLAGIFFLLSAGPISGDPRICALTGSLIGAPALFYANYLLFGGERAIPLYISASLSAIGGTALAWTFFRNRWKLLLLVTLTFAAGEFWTFYAILRHREGEGISAMLAEIFLTFAALYWYEFRRFSAGVLTTMIGLIAWASVFPAAVLCGHLAPSVKVPPGLWNVPKYFVAFGMILALLEDEIFAASKASEHYRLLFVASPHPMWIHDPETLRFLRVNDAAVRHYGYSREEFLSLTLHDLRLTGDIETILRETAKSDSFTLSGPWEHCKKDGTAIQVDIAAHVIDFQGRSCRFVLVQDVTERQRLHAQLVHQAHHDSLTGLPNRLLLEDRVGQAFALASRQGQRAALICIDLDRFKQINDTFGHATGDRCLQHVAARISSRLRAIDTVARTGGEEFVVVLGGLNGPGDAGIVAQDLLEAIRDPFLTDGQTLKVTASMGLAIYPDDGTGLAELWRCADSAMYKAKNGGGNQFLPISPEIRSFASETSELERYMRAALGNGGFDLSYQPVYSIAGGLWALDASLRLNHPRLGPVAPSRFIPVAEECGLIARLSEWAIGEICRQGVAWRREGLKPARISFNVSALQFAHADFSGRVMHALSQHELDPRWLELELTEDAVMGNPPEVGRQMRSLAALGVQFSLGDFGAGYCSLNRLHQLPIGALKIDRSFTERVCAANGTYSIVQAIVAMGHSLGFQIVAAGIERGDQLEMLLRLGCDYLQGHLLAPPAPASRVPRILAQPPIAFSKPARGIKQAQA